MKERERGGEVKMDRGRKGGRERDKEKIEIKL